MEKTSDVSDQDLAQDERLECQETAEDPKDGADALSCCNMYRRSQV